MVCAAVSTRISPEFIEKIHQVMLKSCVADVLDLNSVSNLIGDSIQCMQGIVIAEKGDFYNLEAWRVGSILGRDFKYPESLGERTAIELAHHISFAGRKLIVEPMESDETNVRRNKSDHC
jgi:hypothetical protein